MNTPQAHGASTARRVNCEVPLLSVIVANYNNSEYLPVCLDSILAQTYPRIEIIVADDCSTDDSLSVIERYAAAHSNIHPVYHDANVGVACNRHDGILTACGILITTLDADDYYYDENKLAVEVALIQRHGPCNGRPVIAFSNFCHVNSSGTFIKDVITPRKLQEGDIFYGTITRTRAIPRDFVFSKYEYLQVGGYDRSLRLFEDWDLKLKLAKRNDFFYTGIRGTAYRIHDSGLVQSSPRLSYAGYLWKVFNRHVSALHWQLQPLARVRILGIITRSLVRPLLNRFQYPRRLVRMFTTRLKEPGPNDT